MWADDRPAKAARHETGSKYPKWFEESLQLDLARTVCMCACVYVYVLCLCVCVRVWADVCVWAWTVCLCKSLISGNGVGGSY